MPFPNKVPKTKGQGVSKAISLCAGMLMYVQVHVCGNALDVVKGQGASSAVILQVLSTMSETRALTNLECNRQTGPAGQEAPEKAPSLGLQHWGYKQGLLHIGPSRKVFYQPSYLPGP